MQHPNLDHKRPARPLASALTLLTLLLIACASLPRIAITPRAEPVQATALLPAPSTTSVRSATPQPSVTAEHSTSTAAPSPSASRTAATAAINLTSGNASIYDCQPSDAVRALAEQVQPEPWLAWIRQLSGEEPVTIAGKQVTITTRFTPAMFAANALPSAFDFVLETLHGWYPETQIDVQSYRKTMRDNTILTGKNLVLTIPGTNARAQVILLTAHLDDRAATDGSMTRAPGADDNASGSAALLEAARLLSGRRLEHTLRLIWFTGEEQGMLGSQAYVKSLRDPRQILGDINLDMFAYDGDQDDAFEVHAGELPASGQLAGCFIQAYAAVNHPTSNDPPTFELLTDQAIGASDHSSFWAAGVAAIEISENILPPAGDFNPNYHSVRDTVDRLDATMAIHIVRGALAAAVSLAGLLPLTQIKSFSC